MKSIIDFNILKVSQQALSIDDIGDCAIECVDEDGKYYYMVVYTSLGVSYIHKWGPVVPDFDMLPLGNKGNVAFSYEIISMNFKEPKVEKKIKEFMQSKNFIEARVIPAEEAVKYIPDFNNFILERRC